MQQRKDVVGGVPRVDSVLSEEVTESSHPLPEVPLLAGLDVVGVDGDEAVPVRPRMLVHEAEGVEKLVDWRHQAQIETATETGQFGIKIIFVVLAKPVQFYLLHPPNPPQFASAHPGCITDENVVLRQLSCLPELDARHLPCDVLHRVLHDLPLLGRERVIKLKFNNPTRPQPIRVGKRSIQSRRSTEVALADDNVAFHDGFAA